MLLDTGSIVPAPLLDTVTQRCPFDTGLQEIWSVERYGRLKSLPGSPTSSGFPAMEPDMIATGLYSDYSSGQVC